MILKQILNKKLLKNTETQNQPEIQAQQQVTK